MSTHASLHRHALLIGWLGLVLALLVYCTGLQSDHLATNGDELLYAQISRLTAESGQLLPLQSLDEKARNTKPPLLFWQGIISTDWGNHWSLALLRAPNVLYTLLTAGLLLAVGWKRSRDPSLGLTAALLFLCFFSTYRYGRVFLTSAPETFWLFLPFALLLLHRKPRLPEGILWPWIWGGLVGIGLLYKSFALVVPVASALAIWQLRARLLENEGDARAGWKSFLLRDAWRIGLTLIGALMLFSLWFWLDPNPTQVLKDFVLRENAGKFNTGGENYFLNLIWGQSSIWRIVASYPLNAGLLMLATVALLHDTWKRRQHLGSVEVLLWIWMLTLASFFCLPNQRDERYLLPAMPALALLLALRLGHLPRWVLTVTLSVSAIVMLGLIGLGLLLERAAGIGALYPLWAVLVPATGIVLVTLGFARHELTRLLLAPSILFVYLSYTAFLIPLDRGPGLFAGEGVEAVVGNEVSVPANFNAREESYGFLLPGAVMKRYDHWRKPPDSQFVVLSLPLDQPAPQGVILARRLNMIDRFSAAETRDILMGNVTHHLFHWDWLVQQH
jgi:4-amino-4-deoxy-L-arabinose transferase-like glycosyltransferase